MTHIPKHESTMLGKFLHLILLPTLLLQGMCFGHSHCTASVDDPLSDEQRPHFHLRAVNLFRHECVKQPAEDGCKTDGALGQHIPDRNHDDDAIYVSAHLAMGWSFANSVTPSDDSTPQDTIDAVAVNSDSTDAFPWQASPTRTFHRYPIYLRVMALLI
jgi:hypothetical protein